MKRIKSNRLASQSGTTLIELSVVIAVLLLLATVLFIGVAGWKKGANQAASIVTIATIQKAIRGYENMNQLNDGDKPYTIAANLVPDYFPTAPVDPTTNTAYGDIGQIPTAGEVFATSTDAGVNAQLTAMAKKGTTASW
jgi:prepilin-type N-terminal cleavage/methylation domain-containing protein